MPAGDLAQRRVEPEAMDAPDADLVLLRAALAKLAQFNFLADINCPRPLQCPDSPR